MNILLIVILLLYVIITYKYIYNYISIVVLHNTEIYYKYITNIFIL